MCGPGLERKKKINGMVGKFERDVVNSRRLLLVGGRKASGIKESAARDEDCPF